MSMGDVAKVVLVALVIALMASTVVLSYWGLWKLLRWSSWTTAENWRTMDRRQRLTFVGSIATYITIVGLFFMLLSSGQTGLAAGLAAIVLVVPAAGSIAAVIIASRRARLRAQRRRSLVRQNGAAEECSASDTQMDRQR
jgi:hypothetical protein